MSSHTAVQDEHETPTAKRRRRPALACRQCRRRKIRCDQNIPCNNCTKSKISDCTLISIFELSLYYPGHVRFAFSDCSKA
ncbi:Multidrug resistance regulator 1 like protein [Verticillium longisporum]|nr:Multidrug resistance regulator 1 like protein [Verticillium longisporum]